MVELRGAKFEISCIIICIFSLLQFYFKAKFSIFLFFDYKSHHSTENYIMKEIKAH